MPPLLAAVPALVSAGTSIAGAVMGSGQAKQTQGQVNALYQPYQQAGAGALNQINDLLSPGHDVMPVLESMPGYQAGFDQGMTGLERAENAAGTLNSGGTQKAAVRYGQDYATQTYQNILNNLYKVAGMGAATLDPLASNIVSGNTTANNAIDEGIGGVLNSGALNGLFNAGKPTAQPFVQQGGGPVIAPNTPAIGPLNTSINLPVFG